MDIVWDGVRVRVRVTEAVLEGVGLQLVYVVTELQQAPFPPPQVLAHLLLVVHDV